jgi:hypothetical protein
MKLTNLGIGLMAMGLVAAGCGSDDSTCGDAACPDSAVGSLDGGAGDGPLVGNITSGKYKALSLAKGQDDCMINPMDLVDKNADPMYWLPVDVTGGVMKVGNPKGDGTTDLPSLGTGAYGGFTFTLKRMNHVKVSGTPCEYDADVTSTITNDAIDSFGIGVVEKQMNRTMCVVPAGVGASCVSTYTFRMQKAAPP